MDRVTTIREIPDPLQRSLQAGILASTITTVAAGIVIALAGSPQSWYRFAVASSVLSAAGGAVAGYVLKKETEEDQAQTDPQPGSTEVSPEASTWKDWRHFVVDRKEKESDVITSFVLKPEDGQPLPNFQPGQFLTIRLSIPGFDRPVIRTYSLSDYCDPCTHYRLSIKREPAPQGLDVPAGIASNFMPDQIQVGSVIPAKPPNGKFVLDVTGDLPVVLISNGVGITPMIAMAKACLHTGSKRPIWFLHGARDGQSHAFRAEIRSLADQHSNLHLYYRYSRPQPEDNGHYHSQGYADIDFVRQVITPEIQQITGQREAEYFLCGSPPFLESMGAGLADLGVSQDRVFFEAFTQPKQAIGSDPHRSSADPSPNIPGSEILFSRSGRRERWQPGDGTILEFAEAKGLEPDYSCRSGICLTCMCRIESGEVSYREDPTGTPDQGSVLICISEPKTPTVVLDL